MFNFNVSVTSCLGKKSEHITSQRFIAVHISRNFDFDQFAYLKNRSVTQVILIVAEKIQKGLIQGQKAGAVFLILLTLSEALTESVC